MGWFDSFLEYHAEQRRSMLWLWGALSVLSLLLWMWHILPFSHGVVVSTGVVIERSGCGSKGVFSYTYGYEVDGQAYTTKTEWGAFDGNGSCQEIRPGVVIPITYRSDDPSRSMSGTVGMSMKMLGRLIVYLTVMCFVLMPFLTYIKQRYFNR
ncbi:DUF3592 domain-containing protein [Dyella acidisoli]|uniref:DUF3592 domain-containing protein n=1 Tax=Dyella acidisoli TaxID=1867834 RepID=A0ABQ5XMI2_9GAMM|nr:hypothetical protein [Dyella acidisoli]GLQ92562.1 hypothetical protein GCM10007901_15130 [Dyella acidisoli]